MGSVFVTFATRQDAMNFHEKGLNGLEYRNCKLRVKWQTAYLNDRIEFNDEFSKESIFNTLYFSGFDKLVSCSFETKIVFRTFKSGAFFV